MNNELVFCKSEKGRVWHILGVSETLCGIDVGSFWEFEDEREGLKLCSKCVKERDNYLAFTTGEEFDEEEYNEPASPIERRNPLTTW